MREFEKFHVWYFNRFDAKDFNGDELIRFEGIDTVADIYINGDLQDMPKNMFIPYDIPLKGLKKENNEIVVHI